MSSIIDAIPIDSTETKNLTAIATNNKYWENVNGTATKTDTTTLYKAVDPLDISGFYKIEVKNVNQNKAALANVKSIIIADEEYGVLSEYTNSSDGYFSKEINLVSGAKYLLISYYNVSNNLRYVGYKFNKMVDKNGILNVLFDTLKLATNGNERHRISAWTSGQHWVPYGGKITALEGLHANLKCSVITINQNSYYKMNYGLYSYNPSAGPQSESGIYICDDDGNILADYPTYPDTLINVPYGGTKMYFNANGAGDISNRYTLTEYSQNTLLGKKVAIIGDSISTNGNTVVDGNIRNAVEIVVSDEDVGHELSAYLTAYDVNGGLSLGGHTFTQSEVGNEVTFTPTSEDVGKSIGLPNNYNNASSYTWWEVCADYFGFIPIPVCWSGSSICNHENLAVNSEYKCSWAWHESQIRKCGVRVVGTMNREAPDVIIVYRGCNDMTHSPYARLTDDYFDNPNWSYPEDDTVGDYHGFKEGYAMLIDKLRTAYPNARILLCTLTVFKRVNYSHFPTNNGLYTLPQMNKAIREIADFFGCGIIDFEKCGITFENCYSEGYITDSATTPTHPSDKGHLYMGFQAIRDLKRFIS